MAVADMEIVQEAAALRNGGKPTVFVVVYRPEWFFKTLRYFFSRLD